MALLDALAFFLTGLPANLSAPPPASQERTPFETTIHKVFGESSYVWGGVGPVYVLILQLLQL